MTRDAAALGPLGTLAYTKSQLARIILRTYVLHRLDALPEAHSDDVYKQDGLLEKDWQAVERE